MIPLKCELKKLSKNRLIFVIIAVFVLLDIFNIYRNYNMDNGVPTGVSRANCEIRKKLNGSITEQKKKRVNLEISNLSKLINSKYKNQKKPDNRFLSGYAFWDLQLWQKYQNYFERAEDYSDNLANNLETANQNIGYYKDKNTFYKNENELYFNLYSGRMITEVFDTDSLPDYFGYSFSSILIVIVLLIGVIPCFCGEFECDMNIVLNTSVLGGRKTIIAKLISIIIFTITVSVLFFLVDFVSFLIFDGIDGLSAPLYSVQGYENTPVNLSVKEFIALIALFKTIGMLVISMIFSLLSRLFKKSIVPFLCGFSAFFLLIISKAFLTDKIGRAVNTFNPIALLTANNLFVKFDVLMVVFRPVFVWTEVLFAGLTVLVLLFSVTMMLPLDFKVRLKK